MIIIELIFNLSLLVALSLFSVFINRRWPHDHRLGPLLQGLLFGSAATIGMLNPLVLGPGLLFDGRTVMISLGALFYGPWAALLAAGISIAARLALGGTGVLMGVLVILATAGIGLRAYYLLKPQRSTLGTTLGYRELYLFGLAVHLAMLALTFTLPLDTALAVLQQIGLPVILLFPLATLLAGKIIADQEALRLNESTYRQLFYDHSAPKLLVDPEEGRIVDANQAAAFFYGWSQAELKQMRTEQINILSHREIRAEMEKARALKRYFFEFKHRLADGSVRDVAVFGSPILVNDRALLHAIILDITEQKKGEAEREQLTDQLYQSRKMEAVGRLAGGVAHEFNNMMTVIIANAHLAKSRQPPGSQTALELEEIRLSAERAAEMTRQLLAFARKQMIDSKVLNFNTTIAGFIPTLKRLVGDETELRWQPGDHLPPVKLDPTQLDQLLINLGHNARDAITGTGTITIATAPIELDEAYCQEHPGARPGRYVRLAFRDDGCGMDRETLDKIFEPFFTTKKFGTAVGLGMATIYGIVKQNHGYIEVTSEPGQGTEVMIYLPAADGEEG